MKPSILKTLTLILTLTAATLTARAQTALTVSGSTLEETGVAHTTGNINNSGTYLGTEVSFNNTLTSSNDAHVVINSSTFVNNTNLTFLNVSSGSATIELYDVTLSGSTSTYGGSMALRALVSPATLLFNNLTIDLFHVTPVAPGQESRYTHGIVLSDTASVISGTGLNINIVGFTNASLMLYGSAYLQDVVINQDATNPDLRPTIMTLATFNDGYAEVNNLTLSGSTIYEYSQPVGTSSGASSATGLSIGNTFIGNDVSISIDGGFYLSCALIVSGTAQINNLSVYATGTATTALYLNESNYHAGVVVSETGRLILTGSNTVETYGERMIGVIARGGTLIADNLSVSTHGDKAPALAFAKVWRRLETTTGLQNSYMYDRYTLQDATVVLNGGTLAAESGDLIYVNNDKESGLPYPYNPSYYTNDTKRNIDITLNGTELHAGNGTLLNVQNANLATLTLNDIDAAGDVLVASGTQVTLNLNNSALTGDVLNSGSRSALTVNGTASVLTGDVTGSGSSRTTVNLDASALTGNIAAGNRATVTVNSANGSAITGTVTGSGTSNTVVNLDGSQLNGGSVASDNATIVINGTAGSVIIGDLTGGGTAVTTVNLDASALSGGVTTADDAVITITGSNGSAILGDLTGSGNSVIDVTVTGSDTVFAGDLTANDTARVTVTGDGQLAIGNVTASGDTVIVLDLDNDQITGDITGNGNGQIVITASNGSLIIGDLTGNDHAVIDLTVSGSDTVFAGDLTANDTARVTVTGDGQLAIGNVTASGDTVIVLDLDNDQITGDITGNGNGQIVITASNGSLIIGDLTGNDNAVIDLTVSGSDTWYRGDVTANDDSTVTVTGDGNINIGNVTGGGGSTIDLTIGGSNSGITGGVTGNDDSQITITGSDGVIISGPFNGNNDAVIDITVCGPGSILIGDTTQNDDSSVTITLDDGATGSGGFNGGNLTTGEGSTWTFNKNSHGHRGKNHGTWNVGDYEVIFDDLTNTGTININVNTDTDTGGGGSVVVTGTADGDGKIHIDTTGDGQEDPNKILPGVVTGDGTENWEWDPIDWGIDEIIKDGDHFVKHGTSPAGAVLNSAIAVQQSLWFAQQNSLLKRMGELRYGARTSRPLAGETPAFHNLIENIWLRSYGQQLNVGSKVAGKAYEQLIYGVDLGTDHKFIISADSDLYLGVYAGYGRSDLDYRTPGADGEINSYYGGLYATWLHSSGLYLDATFKAASVDNDLKAPYSNTQLKASYSDVNLGGSLEIGKKFTFSDAWFIEPQFQVNYLHILAEDYTAGPMSLKAQDLDALQLRLGSLFGRTIKLASGGALQPYVKISGVETISSGGAIRNGYQSARANTDGARAEIGGGLIWQLDINNQLHLDYEASFGDKYDKPWGLTAGYRHQF